MSSTLQSVVPVNNPPSAEESELLQEFGGHEPESGDSLLAALRKELSSRASGSFQPQEEGEVRYE